MELLKQMMTGGSPLGCYAAYGNTVTMFGLCPDNGTSKFFSESTALKTGIPVHEIVPLPLAKVGRMLPGS